MRTWALTTNERAECGHTHLVEITADDLTSTVTANAQTFVTDILMGVGTFIERVTEYLVTPFQNTLDAALNSTTMSVGDSIGSVSTILTPAVELNQNGTFVSNKTMVPTGTPFTGFTSPTYLTVTIGSMAGKNLASVNRGVVLVALRMFNPKHLGTSSPYGPPQTKP
jgi:hypothetical protein